MYKKILGTLLFQMVYFLGVAQVGIGTTNPQGALDITSPSDGLLIPRVALVDTTTPYIDTPTQSELVFNTATSGTAPNQVTPGFYFWNGTTWVKILSSDAVTGGWNLTGNAGNTDVINFIGTTDNIPFNIRVNNEKSGKISSSGETFLGYQAGYNNTALTNTGLGYQSLYANTTGYENTATGLQTLRNNTTGFYNTATGVNALFANTTGSNNTANGAYGLYSNTTGYSNTAFGNLALYANTTGYENTATGRQALRNNTTGFWNTSHGVNTLFANTTGSFNTAIGAFSLNSNTTGIYNTAIGHGALYSNSISNYNTAVGYGALSNSTGGPNTAVGYLSLTGNTTGTGNTATGMVSLNSNTTGTNSSAFGVNALQSNTTGIENTSVGSFSLTSSQTGNRNSAFGSDSLRLNSTGSNNVAIGHSSLYSQTTGIGNTAIGFQSGTAGTALLTGNYNTILGYTASVDSSIRTNSIVLAGNSNLALGGDNRVRIGNNAMTSIGGQVAWTTISDERVKQNIQHDVKGLDFLLKLNPVTYNYSIEHSNRIQKATNTEEWSTKHNIEKMRFSGFLAQEVYRTAQEVNYNFSGVDKPDDTEGLWGLRYSEFTVPLVKAVQELHEKNQALEQKNDQLQEQLNLLSTRLQQLEQQVKP